MLSSVTKAGGVLAKHIEVINEDGRSKKFPQRVSLASARATAFDIYNRKAAEGERVTVKLVVDGQVSLLLNRASVRRMSQRPSEPI